jgi:hypothetical protein
MRLLVIEDEPKVGHAFRAEGYEVVLAVTGKEGFSSPAVALSP